MVYGVRGGVVGSIVTMGVIAGTDVPMFLGAMICGPLGAYVMKQLDKLWDGKIRPGFEMLVNNFSAGIAGGAMAVGAFYIFGPIVEGLSKALGNGVQWLVDHSVLPLASLIIEPAKVLFLNNAINHGVLTPLGIQQSQATGKSILFLLEANPGPGLGLLLAYCVFGKGLAKASAPGAVIIHFFGGIHEIFFPYVLMKPVLIVATILGGATGILTNVIFGSGLRAPASPGSIIAVYLQTASGSFLGVTLSVLFAAAVSFVVASVILRASKDAPEGDLAAATSSMESMKGKKSSISGALLAQADAGGVSPAVADSTGGGTGTSDTMLGTTVTAGTGVATRPITNIVFACDAGMGSSAMGASVLRNKIKKAGFTDVSVKNVAIANLQDDVDLVVTHQDLTDRARTMAPSAQHVSVENFMSSPRYDEVVEEVRETHS